MKKTLALSVLLALALSAPAAAGAGKARIYSSVGVSSFLVEPTKLKYTPDDFGGSQTYSLKQLEWDDWGKAKVEGTGVLKSCVDGGDCFTVDATVKASHLLKNDGDPDRYYGRLRVVFGQNAVKFNLPTPAG
jgi:opacity protein-like surface antigen